MVNWMVKSRGIHKSNFFDRSRKIVNRLIETMSKFDFVQGSRKPFKGKIEMSEKFQMFQKRKGGKLGRR